MENFIFCVVLESVANWENAFHVFYLLCYSQIVYRFVLLLSIVKQPSWKFIHKTFWLVALSNNLWYFYIDLLPYGFPHVPILV